MQTRVKYKRINSCYYNGAPDDSVDVRGVYYGSGQELICIYDKSFALGARKHQYSRVKGRVFGRHTRVEVRHSKRKIKIRNFSDLPSLISTDPFISIETIKLNDEYKESKKYELLKEKLEHWYLQRTYSYFNNSNNFKRDYKGYFIESALKKEIQTIVSDNFKSYFQT
ncbi:MAG: hypothetical protein CME60_07250 [Halobacteriovoraceae bacterium]|nr:hypothetical protein [Halobacteriovoraceae bacterium]